MKQAIKVSKEESNMELRRDRGLYELITWGENEKSVSMHPYQPADGTEKDVNSK